VEAERERLGEDHPLFLTQYALLPIHGGGGFLTSQQIAQMMGSHERLYRPQQGGAYVAGIDFAGESEQLEDEVLTRPERDSTVITIAQVLPAEGDSTTQGTADSCFGALCLGRKEPCLTLSPDGGLAKERVALQVCGGRRHRHRRAYHQLPAPVSRQQSHPLQVHPEEQIRAWLCPPGRHQLRQAEDLQTRWIRRLPPTGDRATQGQERLPSQSDVEFFRVDPADGHDGYLMSLALAVQAASRHQPRIAKGRPSNP